MAGSPVTLRCFVLRPGSHGAHVTHASCPSVAHFYIGVQVRCQDKYQLLAAGPPHKLSQSRQHILHANCQARGQPFQATHSPKQDPFSLQCPQPQPSRHSHPPSQKPPHAEPITLGRGHTRSHTARQPGSPCHLACLWPLCGVIPVFRVCRGFKCFLNPNTWLAVSLPPSRKSGGCVPGLLVRSHLASRASHLAGLS